MSVPAIVMLTFAAVVLSGSPAMPADARRGEQLARQWCASCHVVAPDERGPVTEAPPFASIGRKPDFNASTLTFFLLDPHPKMPSMALTRNEASDLAAYIASLAR